jgi:predicted transcriptional regulator
MAGVTSIEVKESWDELTQQLCQVKSSRDKERLQVLYWLKQENPPSISAIAKAVGKHRNTVQTWLSNYREGGVEVMLKSKKSPGGVRVIPLRGGNSFGKAVARAKSWL